MSQQDVTYKALDFDGTERRANYRTVAYRIDILHVLDKKDAAAIIFQIIYRWLTEYKRDEALKEIEKRNKQGLPPCTQEEIENMLWVRMSYNDFVRESGGAVAYNTVIRMLDYLLDTKKVLERRPSTEPQHADFEYRINKEEVSKLLKELPSAPAFTAKWSKKKKDSTQMGTPVEDALYDSDSTQMGTDSTHLGRVSTQMGTALYPNGYPTHTTHIPPHTTHMEENAHVSDDNAPTPSLSESNSPSSLFSQYDLLLAYRDNQLEHLYECEKAAMVNMSKKLSPNRAGELAAAKLSVQFCEQYVRFKDEIDNLARTPSQQVTPEDEALYDWLVDHWNVRSDLTTLSGTRTLILDEDMYRSSLQETIEESTPAPSDEQSSKQAASHSQSAPNTTQDSAKQAPSEQGKQPELIERPKKPVMPPESMKWCVEKMVLVTEALRGKYFTEKQKKNERKAAEKIFAAEDRTELDYVEAFADRNDSWWRRENGLLNISDMAAVPKGKSDMRIVLIWEKLDLRKEMEAQKQGNLKDQKDNLQRKNIVDTGSRVLVPPRLTREQLKATEQEAV